MRSAAPRGTHAHAPRQRGSRRTKPGGDPRNVAGDFVGGGGTALSAPLIPLLILAALLAVAWRQDRWGTWAVGGLTLLAILFAVAGAQEPILWRTLQAAPFGPFSGLVVVLSAGGFILSLLMLVFGILGLIERARA